MSEIRNELFLKDFTDKYYETSGDRVAFFEPWTYETPLVVSPETHQNLIKVHDFMYRSVKHYVNNHSAYEHLAPVSDRVKEILGFESRKEYIPGTYRTDFIVNTENQIKLIEITCRFVFNGLFATGYFDILADKYLRKNPDIRKTDVYSPFFRYFTGLIEKYSSFCFITGENQKNDSRYLIPILKAMGMEVTSIDSQQLSGKEHLLSGSLVILELAQSEIESLTSTSLHAIIDADHMNDLRTIYLIHDKRFFAVLGNHEFLNAALGQQDADEFRRYLIPTYGSHERPDVWENALYEKEKWIIKHRALGMGLEVHAGKNKTEEAWKALFASNEFKDLTIQEFLTQRTFKGTVNGNHFTDYIIGTLLFFNDHYFGPGLFRASSSEITNQGDNRKIAPLVTQDTGFFEPGNIL